MMKDTKECKLEEKEDGLTQEELVETTVNDFCAMMKEDGPVVRALLLKADGSVTEVNYDSTPRNDHISTILGGSPTIVGQLPGELDGVILTKKYTPDPKVDLPNQHNILAQYGQILGDVFVTRLDEKVQPQHFGISEWESFLSTHCNLTRDTEARYTENKEADNLRDVSEEEDEDEEVDPESAIMYSVVNAFMAKNGGVVPTAEQVADILDRMGFNVVDDLTVEQEREYLIEAFEKEHGVKPTAEQLEHLMQKITLTKTAELMSMDYPEDDDDDEEYVPSELDEKEYNMDDIKAQAQSMVMDFPDMILPGNYESDLKDHKRQKADEVIHGIELEADGNEKKVVDDCTNVKVLKRA